MGTYQMRQLPSLTMLKSLQVRGTQRNTTNFPTSLEALPDLDEVDLSHNGLSKFPDGLFTIPSLRKLNMSDNIIGELHMAIGELSFFKQIVNLYINVYPQQIYGRSWNL